MRALNYKKLNLKKYNKPMGIQLKEINFYLKQIIFIQNTFICID